jgi:hypothetical protein
VGGVVGQSEPAGCSPDRDAELTGRPSCPRICDRTRQFVLQVGRHRGRYFLRDGYHRSFGFLSQGVKEVPAFVKDISSFEELVPDPRVILPQDSYQGPRPLFFPVIWMTSSQPALFNRRCTR